MKKNIFYTMQSAEVSFSTFLNCCKTVLLKMYWENVVIKKFLYYNMLLFMSLFFTVNSFGQDAGSSAIKGNFGIDGDVTARRFQFNPNPNVNAPTDQEKVDSDDWFRYYTIPTTPTPVSNLGRGVIDQDQLNPKSYQGTLPGANTSFQLRQSIFAPTAPFPYPVVPSAGFNPLDPSTWVGRYLWLDAVYGRDTYVQGGNAETSYFAGSGDKNSDNPTTWQIGTSGSVPQKDDIIDVYAHIRGEQIQIPPNQLPPGTPGYDATDDRPFKQLWAYAGASLVVTNGNKHLDFEFFRTALETVADLSDPTKLGPNGGRTAWTFDLAGTSAEDPFNDNDGKILVPGTLIISVDYINGGNVPTIRIRVWMSQTTFNNYDNTLAGRPFNVDKTIAFEKGTGSGDFGYAAINPKNNGLYTWGRVNDDFATYEGSRTEAPPFGTFEGVKPDPVSMYTRYQFVEIGIDLTGFGLDRRGAQDSCSNLLGSLLVKTRSSGGGSNEGAFGSELKDFAGPFLFGNTGGHPEILVTNTTVCAGSPVNLTQFASADPAKPLGGAIHFYTDAGYANEIILPGANPTAYVVPSNLVNSDGYATIYVRNESLSNKGCYGENSFRIYVNPNPTIDAKLVCVGKTVDMGTDGTNAWSSSNTTVATINANTGVVTGVSAGTSTITYTNANGCSGTAIVTVYANPTIDAKSVCVGKTVDMGTDGTNAWSSSNTAVATIDANTGVVTGISAGTSTITYTNANGCSGTAIVTVNSLPTCDITGEQTICSGSSSIFTATDGMSSYAWTGPNDFIASTQSINVSVAGIYYVTITNANGCQSTCSRELMVESCAAALCTYTQGYYGNLGGMSCAPDEEDLVDGFGSYTTVELIKRALASYNGSMYIGKQGVRHVLITDSDADIAKLIEVLPGGGSSKELPSQPDNGLFSISNLPPSLLKKGNINNSLLAQTITLGLNIGINGALGDFVLQVGELSTADAEGGCGSDIPKARECHYNSEGNFDYVMNEYHKMDIPQNIIDALISGGYPVTVQGLFELANDVLGGDSLPQGVSYSNIESIVDGINNVFDGCKIPIGYNVPAKDCPATGVPSEPTSITTTAKISSTETAGFIAYEVPVDGPLTIQCTFDYTSDVTIEVFDSKYQLVYTKAQAQCSNGTIIILDYNFNSEQQQIFYIKLTTSQGSTTHDVISKAK
ncbi:MAG: hypothetical protein RLZZ540_3324 [Bacteroidota bacterium]